MPLHYLILVISWRSDLLMDETTDLSQVTDKLYHIMLYRVHLTLVGFKLTMLVVKGTDLHTLENWSYWFGLICGYTYEIQTYTLKSTILTCHQLSRSKFQKKTCSLYVNISFDILPHLLITKI